MITPILLYKGQLKLKDIRIKPLAASSLKLSDKDLQYINDDWQRKLILSKDKKKSLWNGLSHRLENIEKIDNGVELEFSLMEYKIRDGMLAIPKYWKRSIDQWRRGVFMGATVVTSDDKYLYLELSGESFNNNRYEIIGGILEPEKPIITSEDIFNEMLVELSEEALVPKDSVDNITLDLIYYAHKTNVGLYFTITLIDDLKTIQNRFFNGDPDVEVKSLCWCNATQWSNILKDMSSDKKFIAEQLFA
jgi:hypothetical protein